VTAAPIEFSIDVIFPGCQEEVFDWLAEPQNWTEVPHFAAVTGSGLAGESITVTMSQPQTRFQPALTVETTYQVTEHLRPVRLAYLASGIQMLIEGESFTAESRESLFIYEYGDRTLVRALVSITGVDVALIQRWSLRRAAKREQRRQLVAMARALRSRLGPDAPTED
jgi:hypothetical protein